MKGVSAMRACVSKLEARTAPNLAVPLLFAGLLILAGLLLVVPRAFGQTTKSGKAPAPRDTTVEVNKNDEGFTVRVVEDGKAVTLNSRTRAAIKKAAEEAARAAGETQSARSGVPEPPEPPGTPLPPSANDANDLVRFGEDVEIPADRVVDGDVMALGGSVTVYGRVKGDCIAIGGTVRVKGAGVVEGDAVSLGGGVFTADSADVRGSNVSVGAWPFREGHGAMLPLLGIFGLSAFTGIVFRVVELLLTLGFAWIAFLLLRERMVHAADRMGERFGASFLYGLLGWAGLLVTLPAGLILMVLVGVLAIVILCITIIGIPVAILLAVALVLGMIGLVIGVVLAVFVAYIIGAMWLGRRLLGRVRGTAASPLRATAVGLLLMVGLSILGKVLGFIGLILLMPVGIAFGILAGMLCVVMTTAGFGSMILTRFGRPPLATAAAGSAPTGFGPTGPRPEPTAPPAPSEAPPEGGTSDAP
jgi:hypothetical protein